MPVNGKPGNPLLGGRGTESVVADPEGIRKAVFETTRSRPREHKRLFRKQTAADAIAGFSRDTDVFGLTKGQFSLIELLEATLDAVGPSALTVSTWTAANADLQAVLNFLLDGRVTSARFLIDFSFQRRQPAVAHRIREVFGREALRVTRNHAKFFQLSAPERGWTVTCKTSMNLNQNPRLEDFDLSNDPALHDFLADVVTDLFTQTGSTNQEKMNTTELQKQFHTFKAGEK